MQNSLWRLIEMYLKNCYEHFRLLEYNKHTLSESFLFMFDNFHVKGIRTLRYYVHI
jgi:hypothetical protein